MTLRRSWPALIALAVIAVVGVVVGSGVVGSAEQTPEVGVVTTVDSAGLADVRGFTVRTCDGRTLEFRIGIIENAAQFPPGHLAEHQATLQPVRILYRLAGA